MSILKEFSTRPFVMSTLSTYAHRERRTNTDFPVAARSLNKESNSF
jgi:hypothetical protein